MNQIEKVLLLVVAINVCLCSTGGNKPTRLLTDLLEHTDRVWENGRLTKFSFDKANSSLEYNLATVRSAKPTFSWVVPGNKQDTKQTAYEIILSDKLSNAKKGVGDVWRSGIVKSSKSTSVKYGGTRLAPNKVYYWRVRVSTTTDGQSAWSDIRAFKTDSELRDYAASYYPIEITDETVAVRYERNSQSTVSADFKKDAFGRLSVECQNSGKGTDTIIVRVGEKLKDGKVDMKPGGTIRAYEYKVAVQPGKHTIPVCFVADKRNTLPQAVHLPKYVGVVAPFRYCEIAHGKGVAVKSITRHVAQYPIDKARFAFKSADESLNQVVSLCDYSVLATTFAGCYVDGDRERIPYEADALINQLSNYAISADYTLARKTYHYLLNYPTWPTEWILQGIIIGWYDYLYTGDERALAATYDTLKPRLLNALKDNSGLVSTKTGLQTDAFKRSINFNGVISDIVDWPRGGKGLNNEAGGESDGYVFEKYNAVVNAYHCYALGLMAKIAAAVGRPVEALDYEECYKKQVALFNEKFYNKTKGNYKDGTVTEHSSLHANIFPLAFALVDSSNVKSVANYALSRGMACSVYGAQFFLDGLFDSGLSAEAIKLMTDEGDRGWLGMLRQGSTITMEAWNLRTKPNQDWNHAWGTVPSNVVRRKLVGLESLTPGFDSVTIKPQMGELQQLDCKIPTIKGDFDISIKNQNDFVMKVDIPANVTAYLTLPLTIKGDVKVNGRCVTATKTQNGLLLPVVGSGKYVISATK